MTPSTATTPTTTATFSTSEREESEAFRYVRKLRGFYMHLLQYALVIPALWVINLSTNTHYLWAIWPTLGWGLGLSMHALRLFNPKRLVRPAMGAARSGKTPGPAALSLPVLLLGT
jgi:hypothetical protein